MNEQGYETDLPVALALLRDNELAIGTLYDGYAEKFPSQASLWATLADEERQHARWIADLSQNQHGGSGGTEARFSTEAIQSFTDYVREQAVLADRGEVTPKAALTTSYYIETALIERRFFEQLATDDSAVSQVMSRLQQATIQHVTRLQDALHRDRSDTH